MEILNVVLQILTLFALLYFVLTKSYFSEKGRNIATKEDIGKITDKIEKVKQAYNNESELLKANLNLLSDFQNERNKESKKAILNFYDEYNNWLINSLNVPLSKYSDDNFTFLRQRCAFIEECYIKVNIHHERLRLFIDNAKLFDVINELKIMTIEYSNSVNLFVINTAEQIEQRTIVQKYAKPTDNLKDLTDPYRREEMKLFTEHNEKIIEFYKKQRPLFNKFTTIVKETLNNLNQETIK